MTRAELLSSLIEAALSGDREKVRRAAGVIAEEEDRKGHSGVSSRLKALVEASELAPSSSVVASVDSGPGLSYKAPTRLLGDMALPAAVRADLQEILAEHVHAQHLRQAGVRPRSKLLLVGPPGTGKTSLAEAFAGELGIPFASVNYEAVIGSYLGETSERLARLFRSIASGPLLVFFDEFETLGKERADEHETGEVKRIVSNLLLQFDKLGPDVVLVAATNHPELLDRAAWRRFDAILTLPLPTAAERASWARHLAERVGLVSRRDVSRAAGPDGASYADVEREILNRRRKELVVEARDIANPS